MSGGGRNALAPLLAAAVALCIAAPPAVAGTVYSYVDAEGVAHFSNVPNDPRYRKMPGTSAAPAGRRGGERTAEKYETEIVQSADNHGVDSALVKAVIKTESNYDNRAISRAGAQGLMQLMPATSRLRSVGNPFNPSQNIDGGVRHLKYLLTAFQGDTKLALAAYNAGENAVRRYNGVPPYAETQDYVKKVLRHYGRYTGLAPDSKSDIVPEGGAMRTAPIETFVNAEGTRVFTNTPWKYLESPGWRRERSP